jgi:hypothetical protein
VLVPAGVKPTLTVAFAPGLPYQKRYQMACRGGSAPENAPLLPSVIAVAALSPDSGAGPGAGVGVVAVDAMAEAG